jgi:replicative DNA helicase
MEFRKDVHFNLDFENAVLGICLLEVGAFGRVYGMLDVESFYSSGNQKVYAAMKTMYQQGMQIDLFTLTDFIFRVQGEEVLEGWNTQYFTHRLTNYVVSSSHLEFHCYLLKSMWTEREIIRLTHGGANLSGNVREQITELQMKLLKIQQNATEHDWTDMTQLMVDLYRHQEEMKKSGGVGRPTGFYTLDKENGGFQSGQLIVIGARPSVGKSAFMGGIAVEMAKKNLTIGIVSLEMSNTEIAARLASYDTETDFHVVYRGLYRDTLEAERLYQKIGTTTSTFPIYVSDKTRVNVPEIRAKAEKLKALHGLDCLMIDYLQLVNPPEGQPRNRNRENEIAEMSRGCKIIAKEMNIPVLLLCQLNREVTKRKGTDRYPQLSDLRESGAIEQDADVVMFVHRDFMAGIEVDENGNKTDRQADLVVRKWRNGKSNFIIPLDFDPPKMKFTERAQHGFKPIAAAVSSPYEVNKDEEDPF